MRGERGAAFLIALGALALVSALAAAALMLTSGPATRGAAALEQAKAVRAAEAAIHRVAASLAQDEFRRAAPLDGAVVSSAFFGAEIDLSLQDAVGLIDINAAPESTIARLLELTGAAPRDAVEIAALWARARGGRSGYASIEAAIAALPEHLQPIARGAELQLGVWSGQGAVDPWVATAPTLAAAAQIPLEAAQGFVALRALEGQEAALPPGADLTALTTSEGHVIRITARAQTAGGGRAALSAVIRITPSLQQPVEILSWR